MNGWTPERRQRQAAAIQQWRPWERSTGPKSETGKAKVARNAFKGGWRPQLRELAQVLREQRETVKEYLINRAPSANQPPLTEKGEEVQPIQTLFDELSDHPTD